MDVEARIGAEMARTGIWLGLLIVSLSYLLGDARTALAAAIGTLVVIANFLITGWLLSLGARRSPQVLGGVALGGFVFRLLALTAAVWVLLRVFQLDRTGLFIGLAASYLGLLLWQARKEWLAR